MVYTMTTARRALLVALALASVAWMAGLAAAQEGAAPGAELIAPPDEATAAPPAVFDPQPLYDVTLPGADCYCPSVTAESTGTWFRRGWWYAQADAVVLQRQWNRKDTRLAFGVNGNNQDVSLLSLGRSNPQAEGMPRLTLGRFLFRDLDNRDHTVEFTALGGGEYTSDCTLTPDGDNNVQVFTGIDQSREQSFNGADTTSADYASRITTFEWNYVVSSRMLRDRLELQPSGEWVRRANPGFTYQYLAGMRYLDLTENLNWTATNIVDGNLFTGQDGRYLIRTSNDSFGFQLGGGMTYDADRWNLGFLTKGGIMMGDAKGRASLAYFNDGVQQTNLGYSRSDRESTLPFILQTSLTGRYHLRPNLSLRGGYEVTYITAMALAPLQVDFNPTEGKLGVTGDMFYHGISMGMEYYW